ncbi:polysaccharide deacetylase family protein [Sulfitobacter albidus]|uniref:Polysaccharide deacetylase family protein n=1 Tax=Sulfitobacter albidus TaxID=2829501 RepID=A0A975JEA1_9RHOB|nr:polysaccharide deacetylase family protein [Sulfitobacter albidus]QUJ76675.1 polysaccharide deacetylase family protein [Sulfitobacter albidus]
MSVWSPLRATLREMRRQGCALPIWWRDDDAVAATPALERLTRLSVRLRVPVHLAVIPGALEGSLAPFIADTPALVPVVHGWRHVNHAPEGAKKAEFGHPRAAAPEELEAGLATLRAAFGTRTMPMFVPPWNRLTPSLMPDIATAGYAAVSTYGPRETSPPAPGITQINTHIDPIDWRGTRGLVDQTTLVARLTATVRARLTKQADATEPLGLLTHHLVHTPEVWDFAERCLAELLDGGAEVARVI